MAPTAAEKCFAETFVAPHWLPGGQGFWYRRQIDEHKYKFIYVDIQGKSTQPAFDHEKLADALTENVCNQAKIDPDELPFSWIELEDSLVRFRFREQIWQFEPRNGLSKWPGKFTQGNPVLMRRQEPSTHTSASQHVTVAFINNTRSGLILNYVDGEGSASPHDSIPQGKTYFAKTYSGVCWRLEDKVSHQLRGIYRVPNQVHSAVIVAEVDVDEYLGNEGGECSDTPSGQGEKAQPFDHSKPEFDNYIQTDNGGFVQLAEESKIINPHISVRDSRLWLRDQEGIESQLAETSYSEDYCCNEEMLYVCPNKAFVVAWYYRDGTSTKEYWVKCYPDSQSHPKLIERRGEFAGDAPRIDQPRLFSLVLKQEIEIADNDLFSSHHQLTHLGWSKDGLEY